MESNSKGMTTVQLTTNVDGVEVSHAKTFETALFNGLSVAEMGEHLHQMAWKNMDLLEEKTKTTNTL